jgi:hypothetical protein
MSSTWKAPTIDSDDWIMLIWRLKNRWAIVDIIDTYGIEWAEKVIEQGQGEFTAEYYLECYETNNNN